MHHDEFFAKYGKQAIPVETEAEAQFIKEKYNDLVPIVVQKTTEYCYITDSAAYKTSSKTQIPKKETPYSLTQKNIKSLLTGKEFKEARDIMLKEFLPLTREWRFR
jgi:topoisomerase IA-like protein